MPIPGRYGSGTCFLRDGYLTFFDIDLLRWRIYNVHTRQFLSYKERLDGITQMVPVMAYGELCLVEHDFEATITIRRAQEWQAKVIDSGPLDFERGFGRFGVDARIVDGLLVTVLSLREGEEPGNLRWFKGTTATTINTEGRRPTVPVIVPKENPMPEPTNAEVLAAILALKQGLEASLKTLPEQIRAQLQTEVKGMLANLRLRGEAKILGFKTVWYMTVVQ